MKLLLPDAITLNPSLPDGVTAVVYDATRPVPEEHLDATGFVVWGTSPKDVASVAGRMPNLRWVQSLAAGPDSLLKAGFPDDVVLTGGSGLHDATVSEHALALILSLVRRLPQSLAAQAEHRWADELGGTQPLHPEGEITTLIGARVLVWGFGNIGQRLAPTLSALGAHVRGVARSAGTRAGFDVIAEPDLDEALAETDILVMVLPTSPATANALNAARLAALPSHALVVNVGRGSTVDEEALVRALEAGEIGGAGLDVTAVEPLPEDSPLWDAPAVIITPHAAGGRPIGADELIAHNVAALVAGEPLRNVIER